MGDLRRISGAGDAVAKSLQVDLQQALAWIDGRVTDFVVWSPEPREVDVRVNGEVKRVRSTAGELAARP